MLKNKFILAIFISTILIIGLGVQALLNINYQKEVFHNIKEANTTLINTINKKLLLAVKSPSQRLAEHPEIIKILLKKTKPDNKNILFELNFTKRIAKTALIYVMDKTGTVLACTPYGKKNQKTLTGKNYAFRPYFKNTITKGTHTIYIAKGITTGKRGIYYATPVLNRNKVIGVTVVKINLDALDTLLNKHANPLIMINEDGIIFATNRPKWLYRCAYPINAKKLKKIQKSKQFADEKLTTLSFNLKSKQVNIKQKQFNILSNPINLKGVKLISLYAPDMHIIHNFKHIMISTCAAIIAGLIILLILKKINNYKTQNIILEEAVQQRTVDLEKSLQKQNIAIQELQETEHNFKLLFNNSGNAIFLLSGETIIDCNRAAIDMMKANNKSQLLNIHPAEISPPIQNDGQDSRSKAHKMIEAAKQKDFYRFEWVHKNFDGQDFPVEICLTVLQINGKKQIHAHCKDLSNQRAYEKQLQKIAKKAENETKIKSEFLANMSHEIRTPMNGIVGMSALLAQTNLNAEQREDLNAINKSAKELLIIINDILDFSKIEAGKISIELIETDIHQLLNDLYKLMNLKAQEKGIKLKINYPKNAHKIFKADPIRLRQILLNLISNAIKFTNQGSVEINITIDTVAIGQKSNITFSVVDTGIGMTNLQCTQIFNAFTQADGSITRQFGGTGLGLSISKQLVELMNGSLKVKSVKGEGSCFYFTINLEAINKTNINLKKDLLQNRQKINLSELKVLLVEDNDINQIVAKGMLKQHNIVPEIAVNGQEAIEMFNNTSYNIILMDCAMPILDGYETTKIIRQQEAANEHIPIIALTANAMQGDKEKCLAVGMDDFISKPIEAPNLLQILKKYSNNYDNSTMATKVLIVEDDKHIRKIMMKLIDKVIGNADIKVAEEGTQATAILMDFIPNILITDLMMPNMDGVALLKYIRNEPIYKNIKVIVTSALDNSDDKIQQVKALGVEQLIHKPFTVEVLKKAVNQIIQKHTTSTNTINNTKQNELCIYDASQLDKVFPGDIESQHEVLNAAIDSITKLLQECQKSLDDNKLEDASRHAHSIKGAAANIGALRLSDIAKQAEFNAKDGLKEATQNLIPSIQEKLTELKNEIIKTTNG